MFTLVYESRRHLKKSFQLSTGHILSKSGAVFNETIFEALLPETDSSVFGSIASSAHQLHQRVGIQLVIEKLNKMGVRSCPA
jgi:hypothetical protein